MVVEIAARNICEEMFYTVYLKVLTTHTNNRAK